MINTVCLCGSTRFLDGFNEANIELSKRGFSVITISMAIPKNDNEQDQALKQYLDLVHLNKILRSDAVFVIGNGYIGQSTAREILWAHMQGKPVIQQWLSPSWGDIARMLRDGVYSDAIVAEARRVLGL